MTPCPVRGSQMSSVRLLAQRDVGLTLLARTTRPTTVYEANHPAKPRVDGPDLWRTRDRRCDPDRTRGAGRKRLEEKREGHLLRAGALPFLLLAVLQSVLPTAPWWAVGTTTCGADQRSAVLRSFLLLRLGFPATSTSGPDRARSPLAATRLKDLPAPVRVLHDRRIPGSRANTDHIAIALRRVWVIGARRYKGKRPSLQIDGGILRPRTEALRIGGRDGTKLVEGALNQRNLVQYAQRSINRRRPSIDSGAFGWPTSVCFRRRTQAARSESGGVTSRSRGCMAAERPGE